MKNSFRFALAPFALAIVTATSAIAADPGYVDFGKLSGPAQGEFVDITLGKGVLKLASLVAKSKNTEASQLISGLSSVRVNVVGLDGTNRDQATERVRA